MEKLYRKFQTAVVVALLLVAFATIFGIYIPMKRQLVKNKRQNFRITVRVSKITVENFINRCKENAESISSRTMIRKEALKYLEGQVTLEELQDYTYQKYLEGLKVLDGVVSAERIVSREPVVLFGESIPEYVITRCGNVINTNAELVIEESSVMVRVCSPMKEKDNIIGHDIITFDMTPLLAKLNDGDIQYDIYAPKGAFYVSREGDSLSFTDDGKLHDLEEYTIYVEKLDGTDAFLVSRISNELLYSSLNSLTLNVALVFSVSLTVTFFLMYIAILKNSTKLVVKIDEERKKYRELAIKDTLTGVFSRAFFNEWSQKFLSEKKDNVSTIIMIDVDNFKDINDSYGHILGDKVLKTVAEVLKDSVREKDFVVRYGGDEFVIFLPDCPAKDSIKIINRVLQNLKEIKSFDFPIRISYGVAEVRDKDTLIQALQRADARMYASKRSKNS